MGWETDQVRGICHSKDAFLVEDVYLTLFSSAQQECRSPRQKQAHKLNLLIGEGTEEDTKNWDTMSKLTTHEQGTSNEH